MQSAGFVEDELLLEVDDRTVAPRPWTRKARTMGFASASLLAFAAACFGARSLVAMGGQAEQKWDAETIPSSENCVEDGVNCRDAQCCRISGHICYEKDASEAFCRKEGQCVPGKHGTCAEKKPWWRMKPVVYKPGTSMFCYAMYLVDMGPPETRPPNHQLELLQTQHRAGASIFGCNSWAVYSDVSAYLAPGVKTRVVSDVDNDWHTFRRPDKKNLWSNSMIYYQVWKAIRDDGMWEKQDWIVKVDVWTVFIPQRLVDFLSTQSVTEHGDYYETCKYVDSGFFGNLEVSSNKAFTVFLNSLEDCKSNLKYGGGYGWKYGPWGEDLFQQRCFDRHGVEKLPGYGLSNSGTCPNNRPETEKKNTEYVPKCWNAMQAAVHPFRDPKSYFACLATIMKKDYTDV